jgi:hypothetical protein
MDLKQQLRSAHAGLDPVDLVRWCRDALAEIERLEAAHAARQVDALEKIAQALESIDETVTIWHNDGVPIADKLPAR